VVAVAVVPGLCGIGRHGNLRGRIVSDAPHGVKLAGPVEPAAWVQAPTYALFLMGLVAFAALTYWRKGNINLPQLKPVLAAAALSLPIALVQGGTLTELARDFVFGIEGPGLLQGAGAWISILIPLPQLAVSAGLEILGFSLRWPPAILSAHLGALSIFSPVQLIVGLFELGPLVLFTPWITRWAWRRAQAGDWLLGVLASAAWLGLLIPVFFQYQSDRDISRLSWQALLIWTILLLFVVADRAFSWRPWLRYAAAAALGLMVFGGLVIAGTQFSAAATTKLGDGYNELDADIAAQLLASMGQQVTVQFEAKQNGQYTNYDVKGILGVAASVVPAVPAPGQAAPTLQSAGAPPPQAQVGETQDQKQLRIMRQNAIGNAVLAFGAAGIDPVENSAELLEFAQEVLLDFYINGFSLEPVTVDAGEAVGAGPVA